MSTTKPIEKHFSFAKKNSLFRWQQLLNDIPIQITKYITEKLFTMFADNKTQEFLEVCFVQRVKTKRVFTFQQLKFLVSTNIKSAKLVVMSLIFPSRNVSYDIRWWRWLILFLQKNESRLRKTSELLKIFLSQSAATEPEFKEDKITSFLAKTCWNATDWGNELQFESIYFLQLYTTFKRHDLRNEEYHWSFHFGPDVFIRTAKDLDQ